MWRVLIPLMLPGSILCCLTCMASLGHASYELHISPNIHKLKFGYPFVNSTYISSAINNVNVHILLKDYFNRKTDGDKES